MHVGHGEGAQGEVEEDDGQTQPGGHTPATPRPSPLVVTVQVSPPATADQLVVEGLEMSA